MLLEDSKITFRTVTIGDSSVGKTCIVNRFISDNFDPNQTNTIGSLFKTYSTKRDGRDIELHLFDTAGQEQYRAIGSAYFRSAAAALIVYDISNRQSFLNCDEWLRSFREASPDQSLVFLIGNKLDMDKTVNSESDNSTISLREVQKSEGEEWAQKNKCVRFFETSAKTGENVNKLFEEVISELYKNNVLESPQVLNTLHIQDNSNQQDTNQKSCC
ncbi:hypothetical protein M9Y10_042174 [Tritrichomonas musculus]|mgnify:CR=1 FL=1|uniref:Uncharacterized protein n=1 Tax=Tritrichomonas musculus TaxID=1915356 RepID=A0ABR2K6Z8_9EUKA